MLLLAESMDVMENTVLTGVLILINVKLSDTKSHISMSTSGWNVYQSSGNKGQSGGQHKNNICGQIYSLCKRKTKNSVWIRLFIFIHNTMQNLYRYYLKNGKRQKIVKSTEFASKMLVKVLIFIKMCLFLGQMKLSSNFSFR